MKTLWAGFSESWAPALAVCSRTHFSKNPVNGTSNPCGRKKLKLWKCLATLLPKCVHSAVSSGGGGCQPLALSPAGHLAAGHPRFSLCKSSITSVALGVSLTSVFSESLNSRCPVDFRLALMKDPWTPPLPSPAGLKVSLMRRGHPRCQSRSHILGFCHLRYPCFSFLSL